MTVNPKNSYSAMQKAFYVAEASKWSPENRDPVVGSFDKHNAWADYDLLFDGLDTEGKRALDFGCGPGRMMVRYGSRFASIVGVDIALGNLLHAEDWVRRHGFPRPDLYLTNGVDLSGLLTNRYDVVYSTICLQHIPVYDIRINLFREFFRVLKPGGWFTAQTGYGDTGLDSDAGYYENRYQADSTNGGCDVKVTHWHQVMGDCDKCGFLNFSSKIRPVGPGDRHPNWLFFRAQKPEE